MLYTSDFLKELSMSVGQAVRNYHKAVAENLQSIGRPVMVQGDDPDVEGIDLTVEYDGRLWNYTFNYVFWDKVKKEVMVHYTMLDYSERDDTMYLSELGDATDYLLDAIQWDETTDREAENDNLYAFVGWPEFQKLLEKEGFDENAYFCAEQNAWFIRQGWLRENNL